MTRGILGLTLSLIMLSSSAVPAFAKHDGRGAHGRGRQDDHARFGLNNRGGHWNPPTRGGANAAAIAQFDARANELRADIAARAASGALSGAQAARLNARLDSLLSLRSQYGGTGGVLTGAELGQLNARLNELRIGVRSRIYF